MEEQIAILILAAGNSARMQEKIKQLLPWKKTTLLGNAIEQALKVKQDVYVILGAHSGRIKKSLQGLEIHLLEHKEWEKGIGSTIAYGLTYVKEQKKYNAVFIQLADQPLMNSRYLNKMLQFYQRNPTKIIATKYSISPGVPAIFGREHWEALMALSGDSGAKQLLKSKEVITMDPKDKAVDIDTWSDYQKLLQQ